MKKILIAYYSRKGQNYVSGSIVNLPVGNTEVIAQKIQALTGGDTFHIETIKSYPAGYMETTEVARRELDENARPELTDKVKNMEQYDTIILGYPNWWSSMPMAVHHFLDSYDFSGKTIMPYCTHEGSGMGHSVSDIKKLCPEANVLNGIPIKGSQVKNADREVQKIIEMIGI